jgi:hypothetical protein
MQPTPPTSTSRSSPPPSAASGLDLRDIQENYHKAALGAWQLSNQLGNILQAIADKWLIAGIAWAAGTATAESGIGAVVGYGVAGLQVVQMLKLFNDASTKIGKYGAIVAGIFVGGMDIGYKNRIQEWRPIHRPAPVSLLHKPRSLS